MQPGNFTITIHDRTSYLVVFTLRNKDKTPFDLTGYTVKAQANGEDPFIPGGVLDLAPVISDAEQGQITITKTVAETTPLSPGATEAAKWDLLIVNTATTFTTKVLKGSLKVVETETP